MSDRGRVHRMLDANLNRLSEGLRVVEDVFRFARNSGPLSGEARRIRHSFGRTVASMTSRKALLASRRSASDVGAKRWTGEKRSGLADLVSANLRRAQESARVLEEGARFLSRGRAIRALQRLRYRVYELERRALGRRGR